MSVTQLPCVDHSGPDCAHCADSHWITLPPFEQSRRGQDGATSLHAWVSRPGLRWILLGLAGIAVLIYAGGVYLTDVQHQQSLRISPEVVAGVLSGWMLLSAAALVIGGLTHLDSAE